MKCGIMRPDLTVCAEEFAETGLVTPERMRAIDANAQALGVSGLQLMESAGRALAGSVLAYSPQNRACFVRPGEQRGRRHGGGPVPPAGGGYHGLLSRSR